MILPGDEKLPVVLISKSTPSVAVPVADKVAVAAAAGLLPISSLKV